MTGERLARYFHQKVTSPRELHWVKCPGESRTGGGQVQPFLPESVSGRSKTPHRGRLPGLCRTSRGLCRPWFRFVNTWRTSVRTLFLSAFAALRDPISRAYYTRKMSQEGRHQIQCLSPTAIKQLQISLTERIHISISYHWILSFTS